MTSNFKDFDIFEHDIFGIANIGEESNLSIQKQIDDKDLKLELKW